MANEGFLSGEDVGMILLGKEIQILNLQKQEVALQQQIADLAKALEEASKAGKAEKQKDDAKKVSGVTAN